MFSTIQNTESHVDELALVGEALERIHTLAGDLPTPQTSELLRYQIETGGKRLRPLLVFRLATALAEDPRRVIPLAACCELIHQATLVHDDLQDRDRYRRGAPTVWHKYGAHRAIDLGDAMLYHALLLLGQLEVPANTQRTLQSFVIETVLQVIEGQEREFALSRGEMPTLKQYIDAVSGKTGALLMLPLVGAARVFDCDTALVSALRRASLHLGIAYQIRNDVLNVFTREGRASGGSDIGEGKRSALVVFAAQSLDSESQRRLLAILDLPRDRTTPAQVRWVQDMFLETGAVSRASRSLLRHADAATQEPALTHHPAIARLLLAVSRYVAHDVTDLARLTQAYTPTEFTSRSLPSETTACSSSTLPRLVECQPGGTR